MSRPYLCPKCNGFGQLLYDPNMPFAAGNTNAGPWPCPVCLSTGIIWDTSPDWSAQNPPPRSANGLEPQGGPL